MLLLFTFTDIYPQFYNGSQMDFGKNRVQYKEFFWTYYRFEKFDTYFYLNGKELAVFTAKYADLQIDKIEKKLEASLDEKIQFLVFNNLTDLKQSNIGLINKEQYNIGGITHILGRKVFIYFDGNYTHFETQIRAGIAHKIINQMLYGPSLGSQIKNSTLTVIPDWYFHGLIAYISEGWNTDIDNIVKDGILSGKYEKFNRLIGKDAINAGHSFWEFIANKYGKSTITEIIRVMENTKNVESSFLYPLGVDFKTLCDEWISYYKQKYNQPDVDRNLPENLLLKKIKKDKVYSQLTVSPNGEYAAFVSNEIGKYKVWIYNFENKKSKKIMKSGFMLDEKTDYSYPLLTWHPTSKLLALIIEKKGEIHLKYYTLETKKFTEVILYNFEKILSFSYSDDGKYFVFSATRKGQSDIYIYDIAAASYVQLTNDIYDDLFPKFIYNSKRIIFSSNRKNDTLRYEPEKIPVSFPQTNDLFLYNYSSKSNILLRITNTPFINEIQPTQYQENYFSYLSDQNGIYNRFIGRFDSTISYIDTATHYRYFSQSFPASNFSRNIIEQNINPKSRKISQIIFDDNLYKLYVEDLILSENITSLVLKNTSFMEGFLDEKKIESNDTIVEDQINISEKRKKIGKKRFVNVHANYSIEKPVNDTIIEDGENETKQNKQFIQIGNLTARDIARLYEKVDTTDKFIIPKKRNYNVEYFVSELITQIDFTFLNTSYQPFTGGGSPIFLNPSFNIFLKFGVMDLLEDYRLVAGVKLDVNLKNNEYLFSYSNLKKRLDKEIIFHKQTLEDVQGYSIIRHRLHEFYYILKWPFNEAMSLRGTASFRNDIAVYLATDELSLRQPNIVKNWLGIKGEFVYDDTRELGLNLYQGTRYKFFLEYNQNIESKGKNLMVVGFDFRNYQKIHRTFIWANRFAISSSFGTNKLIYYMGGVDTWLIPEFDNYTPIDFSQNYAFQTLATNLRGFKQNIRNGNSFFVINSELRFPVFKYFFNRPINSDFLNNFQIVGFADIGTAWTGFSPYSSDNFLYTKTINDRPLRIEVKVQSEPIVGGLGCGLRSRLLGYFIRADLAWGIEDYELMPSIFYISLSLDF
ncbi:MAG: PD40 domain-containing protein [Bacteroidales bacterium]|nr:PD40 domain-containing protein [Bacteroidales bacterium]